MVIGKGEIMPGKIDLLLVFYINVGQLPPKEAINYLRKIKEGFSTDFPGGVSCIFIPIRVGESYIQPIPIKGFLDGTLKETPKELERLLKDMLIKMDTIRADSAT